MERRKDVGRSGGIGLGVILNSAKNSGARDHAER